MDDKFIRRTVQAIIITSFVVILIILSLFSIALIFDLRNYLTGNFADIALIIVTVLSTPFNTLFGPVFVVIASAFATTFMRSFYDVAPQASDPNKNRINMLGRIMFIIMIGIVLNTMVGILLLHILDVQLPLVTKSEKNPVIATLTALASFNSIYIAQMMGIKHENS